MYPIIWITIQKPEFLLGRSKRKQVVLEMSRDTQIGADTFQFGSMGSRITLTD
jgi:hypothetical protein